MRSPTQPAPLGRRSFLGAAAAGTAALVGAPSLAWASSNWRTISREKGVVVSLRDEEGREFPTFRGVGRVDANMWDILAVLEDASRHTEWMHKCVDAYEVERISNKSRLLYNRTDAPWPVSDRDVVLKSTFSLTDGGTQIWAKFSNTSSGKVGEVAGVVRMPTLAGHYRLMRIDDDNTLVEYQVNADPGGTLPDWLVKSVTKDLPMHTVANLRRQVRATRGSYDVDKLKAIAG